MMRRRARAYNRRMYTQCPGCRTIFEIDEDALQASLGIVRCGHCSERFDALRTLSSTLPLEPGIALPEHDPGQHAPTLTTAVSQEVFAATSEARRAAGAEAASPPEPDTPDEQAPAAHVDDEWLTTLSGEHALALIADAAGIPPDAIQGDPAWESMELPVQTGFIDLDTIPIASAAHTVEAAREASPDEPLESGPLDEPWVVDIPDAGSIDPSTASEQPPDDAAEAESSDVLTQDDATGIETVSDPASTEVHPETRPVDTQSSESGYAIDDSASGKPDGIDSGQDEIIEPYEETSADNAPESETGEAVPAMPVYVPPRSRRIRRHDLFMALACVLLAAALATQLAWAKRVALIRDPATRPWALRVCASLDCRLPPIRDIAKLALLSRDIRPDPDAAGALMITATLRNDAPFRQPWPIVVVELTDLDNNVVAMRRFRPAEYMPDAARRIAGLTAGTTAAVAFEVADPGKRAVSFHFGFE
jgi:predicted Zn finger-like uncharacterized protein